MVDQDIAQQMKMCHQGEYWSKSELAEGQSRGQRPGLGREGDSPTYKSYQVIVSQSFLDNSIDWVCENNQGFVWDLMWKIVIADIN